MLGAYRLASRLTPRRTFKHTFAPLRKLKSGLGKCFPSHIFMSKKQLRSVIPDCPYCFDVCPCCTRKIQGFTDGSRMLKHKKNVGADTEVCILAYACILGTHFEYANAHTCKEGNPTQAEAFALIELIKHIREQLLNYTKCEIEVFTDCMAMLTILGVADYQDIPPRLRNNPQSFTLFTEAKELRKELAGVHSNITFSWVKAHSENPTTPEEIGNARVDFLAKVAGWSRQA